MVVLRRKSGDIDRSAIKLFGQICRPEQPIERKAEALDPVFRRQIDGREDCEAAVGWTGDHAVVLGLRDWTGALFNLTGEEIIEGLVLSGIGLLWLCELMIV
jgi:hypothetical protein